MRRKNSGVQLSEKGNCLEILIVSVHVRDPLSRLSVVIEVKHRRNGIYAESVRMVHTEPEKRVRYQEGLYLRSSHVKASCSPSVMLHAVASLIFVKRTSVEFEKTVTVLREMRRHPIENHSDTRFMEAVDEVHEILGISEPRGRGEISAYLISPRSVERMLHHRQELNVGISHFLDIRDKLIRDLPVIEVMLTVCGARAVLRPP